MQEYVLLDEHFANNCYGRLDPTRQPGSHYMVWKLLRSLRGTVISGHSNHIRGRKYVEIRTSGTATSGHSNHSRVQGAPLWDPKSAKMSEQAKSERRARNALGFKYYIEPEFRV